MLDGRRGWYHEEALSGGTVPSSGGDSVAAPCVRLRRHVSGVTLVGGVAMAAIVGIVPAMKITRRMGHLLKQATAGSGVRAFLPGRKPSFRTEGTRIGRWIEDGCFALGA